MATANKDMNEMMRSRRKDMMDLPAYEGPPSEVSVEVEAKSSEPTPESSEQPENAEGLTVIAPGEPSTGEKFEYEPLTDAPGAWAVYPPGVPCDENEYRVAMDRPAGKDDFAKMTKAIEDAGGTTVEPTTSTPGTTPVEEEGY